MALQSRDQVLQIMLCLYICAAMCYALPCNACNVGYESLLPAGLLHGLLLVHLCVMTFAQSVGQLGRKAGQTACQRAC